MRPNPEKSMMLEEMVRIPVRRHDIVWYQGTWVKIKKNKIMVFRRK